MTPSVFFPNLDALRFFAFLSVFLYHSFDTDLMSVQSSGLYQVIDFLTRNGYLGVNFFFVLSGFLITFLLFDEKSRTGRIDLWAFYVRRILRIWPLYFFTVGFGFVVFPILKSYFGETPQETANPWMYVSFLANFDMVWNGKPDASVLSVLWSVAVEEQFYLVWPIILSVFQIKRLPWIFTIIIGMSLVYRAENLHNETALDMSTWSAMSDLAVGAWAAYLVRYSPQWVSWVREWSAKWIGGVYFLGVGFLLGPLDILEQNPIFLTMSRLIVSVLFAFIILEQNEAKYSLWKLGRVKVLSELGKISYGLYCLHFIAILIVLTLNQKLGWNHQAWQVVWVETGIALGFTIGMSSVSYKIFESPFLKLKTRWAR